MLYQPPLPPCYMQRTDAELADAIGERKRQLGRRLVILGHHYQQDDVIRFADFTGDSLRLSKIAAEQKHAEFVVFCGVHFMAESADILTDDRVAVILPDLSAGCSMADMAAIEQVEEAWEVLTAATGETIIPITYVNSAASIKAFCGGHGGACCTSSNAPQVIQWALTQGGKVMFLPDQHLGRNAAYGLGWPLDSMVVYDPNADGGGLTAARIREAKFILWKGHCSVHQLFTPEQCDQFRTPPSPFKGEGRGEGDLASSPSKGEGRGEGDRIRSPASREDTPWKIIVHPECDWSVVQKADLAGSTEFIIKTIDEAPPGSRWAVGTEINLVNRLATRHAGVKTVRSLAGIQCLCSTMYRIDMPHLLYALDNLAEGRIVNRITVDPETKRLAVLALDRMLANVSPQPVAVHAT